MYICMYICVHIHTNTHAYTCAKSVTQSCSMVSEENKTLIEQHTLSVPPFPAHAVTRAVPSLCTLGRPDKESKAREVLTSNLYMTMAALNR